MATLAAHPADSTCIRAEESSRNVDELTLSKLFREVGRWFGGMQARAELRNLSDATLADVGLRRDGRRIVPYA